VTPNEDYIIEILLDAGLITNPQIERAKVVASRNRSTVIEALIEEGVVTQEDVTRAVAAHSSMDYVDLSQMTITPEGHRANPRRNSLALQGCPRCPVRHRPDGRHREPARL
jgi:hypothetical protein